MEDAIKYIGKFRGNEDEDYISIFDGHGGKEASEFASKNLHIVIFYNFLKKYLIIF